jgi:dTMP kinase
MRRGRLIAFEGGEGSGKSTQAERLACALGAVLTREPGGTTVGEGVRKLLLDPDLAIGARSEALLMAAARAQHVDEVISPALEAGQHVVTDRYLHSSLAYQGYGRGLDLEEVRRLSEWATHGLWPDLVILLEVPADESLARRQAIGHAPDRLEAEDAAFHQRVSEGFRVLAAADPDRWRVVDGLGSLDEVAGRVRAAYDGWERDQ